MKITDGTGKSFSAGVNEDGKLQVTSVSATIEHYINHNIGDAYNLLFSSTPTSGGCFVYIKNTNINKNLIVEGMYLKMESDDFIEVKINDVGNPSNGITLIPGNLNSGSGLSATGVFQSGNDIIGLSGGRTVFKVYHANSKETIFHNFNQDLVLVNNGVMSFYIGSGSVPINGMIAFNYHGNLN